jgi:putative tryptophan/tyrosine transport system substrate-binding protein
MRAGLNRPRILGRHEMNRRMFLAATAAATLLGPRFALAQGAANRPIIAFLVPQTKEAFAERVNAFLAGLKELGYVDGQNVTVEYRYTDGVLDRQPALAAELVKLGPRVLVTGNAAAVRASEATSTIPIVVGNFSAGSTVTNQAIFGANNLTRPLVPNMTGIIGAETGPRQYLDLTKELFPAATQVGYMLSTDRSDGGAADRARADAASAATGIKLVYAEAKAADGVEPAFRSLAAQRLPAIIVDSGTLWSVNAAKVIALAAAARIPCVYASREIVLAGGLIAASNDSAGSFRRAATLVDRILKGAKPADLPVEQFIAQLLTVNLNTAKTLGLTIPPAVLARATEKIA